MRILQLMEQGLAGEDQECALRDLVAQAHTRLQADHAKVLADALNGAYARVDSMDVDGHLAETLVVNRGCFGSAGPGT